MLCVEIRRCLLLGRKAMINLDSILESRDITLTTKVRIVKAMVFSKSQAQSSWVPSLGREDPLEKEMATHSSILAGRFHGQRSPAGYSP